MKKSKKSVKKTTLSESDISIEDETIRVQSIGVSKEERILSKKNAIPLTAIFVSLCTLFLTVYQFYKIRVHNELSVKPKVQFSFLDAHGKNKSNFLVKVKNKGIGPAIIDDMSFIFSDGQVYTTSKMHANFWTEIFAKLNIPHSMQYNNITYFSFEPNSAISANEEVIILQITSDSLSMTN
ncbi:hypothetical protein Emtol_3405 [Emticicia oligotrophica DSM 17448]|uniref:DUF4352 domain-containing protein n=1 Tax=Emticicia oligotrophica (strain DSM 17448 / CIP 109782 / MTCC 6937 / GPTSA100-15) TaxID=929562 RepID=A0ABM5N500_EMTOG|nr:hypothetical protein [Emticicia oligotrophica]AFK04534.1 hypothetical protein Emtol_3405 [Emticicia oligotrophica DSM 17448]